MLMISSSTSLFCVSQLHEFGFLAALESDVHGHHTFPILVDGGQPVFDRFARQNVIQSSLYIIS